MGKLKLTPNQDVETNIQMVLQRVVELERAQGLSDEEIKCKYTCGCCGPLVDMVAVLLEVHTKQKVRKDIGSVMPQHCSISIPDPTTKNQPPILRKKIFYDILGRHDETEKMQWRKDLDYLQTEVIKKYDGRHSEWEKGCHLILTQLLEELESSSSNQSE